MPAQDKDPGTGTLILDKKQEIKDQNAVLGAGMQLPVALTSYTHTQRQAPAT